MRDLTSMLVVQHTACVASSCWHVVYKGTTISQRQTTEHVPGRSLVVFASCEMLLEFESRDVKNRMSNEQ